MARPRDPERFMRRVINCLGDHLEDSDDVKAEVERIWRRAMRHYGWQSSVAPFLHSWRLLDANMEAEEP